VSIIDEESNVSPDSGIHNPAELTAFQVGKVKFADQRSGAGRLYRINHEDFQFKFTKTRPVKSPVRAHDNDAGIDFFVPDDFSSRCLAPHIRVLIPAGIKVKLPRGYALIFFNKSGVATRLGLDVLPSVVDESYHGEVHLGVVNTGSDIIDINPGMKLLQGILIKMNYINPMEVETEEELYAGHNSERNAGGFGSTGD